MAILLKETGGPILIQSGGAIAINQQVLTVPAAPTIGTASAGNAQSSVSFTANGNGGSPITSFTVTSSPGGFTATGAASPLTVSGLTNGTSYTFTVTATNIIGTSLPSAASNAITPVAPALSVAVAAGGKLVNGSGATLTLRGANAFGLEASYALGAPAAYPWDYGGWTADNTTQGGAPDWSKFATNHWNVVRLPVNEQSVLGYTTYIMPASSALTPNGGNFNPPTSLAGLSQRNMDPGGTYLSTLDAVVNLHTAAGRYVVIDMHITMPDMTIGGTTVHVCGASQYNPMPNANTLTAWGVLANRYKSYSNVMFDLYNEPQYPTWSVLKNGGTQTLVHYQDERGSPATYNMVYTWTSVGYQALLTAVRNTGATNVCLVGCIEYAQELGNNGFYDTSSTWLLSVPTDTLNPPQICASVHLYPAGLGQVDPATANATALQAGYYYKILTVGTTDFTLVGSANNTVGTVFLATGAGTGTGTVNWMSQYGSPNYYRQYGADQNPGGVNGFRQWIPFAQSIIAAGYPLFIGEMGGQSQGTGEPFSSDVVAQIDTLNTAVPGSVHVTGWGYNPFTPPGINQLVYYTNTTTVVPTTAYGTVYTNWTTGHA